MNDEVAQAASKSPTNRACGLEHASTITSVAMNPGLMLDTGFVTAIGGKFLGYVAWALIPLLRWTPVGRLMRDATMSGQDLARLAVDEKFAGITAAFFDGNKQKPSSEFSREMESVVSRQVELWDRSMVWAKVSDEERRRAGL